MGRWYTRGGRTMVLGWQGRQWYYCRVIVDRFQRRTTCSWRMRTSNDMMVKDCTVCLATTTATVWTNAMGTDNSIEAAKADYMEKSKRKEEGWCYWCRWGRVVISPFWDWSIYDDGVDDIFFTPTNARIRLVVRIWEQQQKYFRRY